LFAQPGAGSPAPFGEFLLTLPATPLPAGPGPHDRGGKRKVAMAGAEFVGRLLQHGLPLGFKRIRHYGLLAQAAKAIGWRWRAD